MKKCVFCLREIEYTEEIWEYEGTNLPAHSQCRTFIMYAIQNYQPVKKSEDSLRMPRTHAYLSICPEDFDPNWAGVPEDRKSEYHQHLIRLMNKALDTQEVAVRAYCAKMGIPPPEFTRRIEIVLENIKQLDIMKYHAKPGDHIVVANIPRRASALRKSDPMVVNRAKRIAETMARRGITFHCVYNLIDWGNPLCQAYVRLAVASNMMNSLGTPNAPVYENGRIKSMYGFSWEDINRHKIFLWTIKCIRDARMTPEEVYAASRKYHSVISMDVETQKVHCIAIVKNHDQAKITHLQTWRGCRICRTPTLSEQCPQHPDIETVKIPVAIIRGIEFRHQQTFRKTILALWQWYCEKHPDQDKMPWRQRFSVDKGVR